MNYAHPIQYQLFAKIGLDVIVLHSMTYSLGHVNILQTISHDFLQNRRDLVIRNPHRSRFYHPALPGPSALRVKEKKH